MNMHEYRRANGDAPGNTNGCSRLHGPAWGCRPAGRRLASRPAGFFHHGDAMPPPRPPCGCPSLEHHEDGLVFAGTAGEDAETAAELLPYYHGSCNLIRSMFCDRFTRDELAQLYALLVLDGVF